MTTRQFLLKLAYPFLMMFSKKADGNGIILTNTNPGEPPVSFYNLSAVTNSGKTISFSEFKGKHVLIVNTASDCGYTAQFAELQTIHQKKSDRLVILGFPANDFDNQELNDDQQIAQFCQINYGVTFPVMKKGRVISGNDQHPVFQWLTQKSRNGWNDRSPDWNFSKFLISPDGRLVSYGGPAVKPGVLTLAV